MKVLVCGGRNFLDWARLFKALDDFHGGDRITRIIEGGAKGADTGAAFWAFCRGVPYDEYPADWARHGKAAGPRRNQRMLDLGRPNFVIAFPGGHGTADMVKRASAIGTNLIFVGST